MSSEDPNDDPREDPREDRHGGDLPYALTLQVRDSCLGLHVRRAARAVTRRFDEALRPTGLTSGQFSLMMALNRPAPPAMGDVASVLAMDRTTLTANLKPLVRRGLVTASPDAADRRSRRLALTPAGRKVLAAAVPIWQAAQAAIESRLDATGADADTFRAALRTLS